MRQIYRYSGGTIVYHLPPVSIHVCVKRTAVPWGEAILVPLLPTRDTKHPPRKIVSVVNRCNALNAWLVNKSAHLWLKPSSEVKVWVKDVFRRPQTGPAVSEAEVSKPGLCNDRFFFLLNFAPPRAA